MKMMNKPAVETEPVMLTQAVAELIKAVALMAAVLAVDIPNETVEALIKLSGAVIAVAFLAAGLLQGLLIRQQVYSPAKVQELVEEAARTGDKAEFGSS
jgi:hypothetical protein